MKRKNSSSTRQSSTHNERCPDCKKKLGKMLALIFDDVEENVSFDTGASLSFYKNSKPYPALKKIYQKLQNHRNYSNFVRVKKLPNCDYYIPSERLIVEFDESQHFTKPRMISLKNYPISSKLALGFSSRRWQELCTSLDIRDNDPPFRDEQRAWYDTLRDFMPAIKGFRPTVRLYSKDFQWCGLDENNTHDQQFLKSMLNLGTKNKAKINTKTKSEIARIIIAKNWDGSPRDCKKLMTDLCKSWPSDRKVKYIITPGGFLQFDWPKTVTENNVKNNKNPPKKVLDDLFQEGEKFARKIIDRNLREKLSKITEYLTLGVDSYKPIISLNQNPIGQPHVELVFLFDLKANIIYHTAKSYPTSGQENSLIINNNLKSHFIKLPDGEKVMLLGCHDLNIFNNRNMKNTNAWRKNMKIDFRNLSKKFIPDIVLQHPHTTDTSKTWTSGISGLQKILPTLENFASAGRFFREGGTRYPIYSVLDKTRIGITYDVIIR